MNAGARLGAFGVGLVAVLGVGAATGAAVGPIDTSSSSVHHEAATGSGAAGPGDDALPAGGLLVSQDGYTFAPESRTLDGGDFAFAITGPDGTAVTDFAPRHDRELHLVVVSSDLTQYLHLHPALGAAGRWTVTVPSLSSGAYRAFADFKPHGGDPITLGIDVSVPGTLAAPIALEPSSTDRVDGFDVELATDDTAGTATVTVRRDGTIVTTEPYLGAAGHLVAIRDGDLAYLHVHPLDDDPSGPVAFAVEYPSAGTYALFFDFQVGGAVHTARFVVASDDGDADDGDSEGDGLGHGDH